MYVDYSIWITSSSIRWVLLPLCTAIANQNPIQDFSFSLIAHILHLPPLHNFQMIAAVTTYLIILVQFELMRPDDE